MPLQQHQSEDGQQPHRMTSAETKAVIDLWLRDQQRKDAASVDDVAEGLDIPTDQVEQLLQQVRSGYAKPARPDLRSKIGWAVALLVLTILVTEWTQGTAFTFGLQNYNPVEAKWFIGGTDIGLGAGLVFLWRGLILYLRE